MALDTETRALIRRFVEIHAPIPLTCWPGGTHPAGDERVILPLHITGRQLREATELRAAILTLVAEAAVTPTENEPETENRP